MATYGVCFVLVLSFILFEVLDVDGSDFASPWRMAATVKGTDPAQDLRRVPLQASMPTPVIVIASDLRVEKPHLAHGIGGPPVDRPSRPALGRASRTTLARGLLADPAPSV